MIWLKKVLIEVDVKGRVRPMAINFGDDPDLRIERILLVCPMKSRKDRETETGMRYVVRIQGKDVVLCSDVQWWIEE